VRARVDERRRRQRVHYCNESARPHLYDVSVVPQPIEPGFNYSNFRIDLIDEQTEIEAGLSLQKECQFLSVPHQISERAGVV